MVEKAVNLWYLHQLPEGLVCFEIAMYFEYFDRQVMTLLSIHVYGCLFVAELKNFSFAD